MAQPIPFGIWFRDQTQRHLSAVELVKAGVTEAKLRLSIGIESIDGILADIEQALAAAWEQNRQRRIFHR